jgi:hypothetical protein
MQIQNQMDSHSDVSQSTQNSKMMGQTSCCAKLKSLAIGTIIARKWIGTLSLFIYDACIVEHIPYHLSKDSQRDDDTLGILGGAHFILSNHEEINTT